MLLPHCQETAVGRSWRIPAADGSSKDPTEYKGTRILPEPSPARTIPIRQRCGSPLDAHLEGVESWAKRIGGGTGLPEPMAADLALAARLHDVGKADPRFQLWMHGGNPWAVGLPLLAKSDRTRTRSSGCRHELLSVCMIENSGLLESAHDKDLVLHLVASHHGHCRPFAPVVDNSNPVLVEETILGYQMSACTDTQLERLDSGVPERFWRLARRYGWWGPGVAGSLDARGRPPL